MTAFWPRLDRSTGLPTVVRADLRVFPDAAASGAGDSLHRLTVPGRPPAQLPRAGSGTRCVRRRSVSRWTPRIIATLTLAICAVVLWPSIAGATDVSLCPAGTVDFKLDNLTGETFTVPDLRPDWDIVAVSVKVGNDEYLYTEPPTLEGRTLQVKADTGHDVSHVHLCKIRVQNGTTTTEATTSTTSTTTEAPTTSTSAPSTTVVASTSSTSTTTTTTVAGSTTSSTSTTQPGATSTVAASSTSTLPPTSSTQPDSTTTEAPTTTAPASTSTEPTTTSLAPTTSSPPSTPSTSSSSSTSTPPSTTSTSIATTSSVPLSVPSTTLPPPSSTTPAPTPTTAPSGDCYSTTSTPATGTPSTPCTTPSLPATGTDVVWLLPAAALILASGAITLICSGRRR